ncbi:hypothetical protein INR49_027058 [Caranx melampygus]|nr:hypothetical protein INR49_027058 [Caranx melampygus]
MKQQSQTHPLLHFIKNVFKKKTLFEGEANPQCHLILQCNLFDFMKDVLLTFLLFKNVTADYKQAPYYIGDEKISALIVCLLYLISDQHFRNVAKGVTPCGGQMYCQGPECAALTHALIYSTMTTAV